jgi:hypothetical protein
MAKKEKQDNIISNVEFGTTQPNTQQIDAEQLKAMEQYQQHLRYCFAVGQATLDLATRGTKEEFLDFMLDLYNGFHQEDNTSKIEVPQKKIILPK